MSTRPYLGLDQAEPFFDALKALFDARHALIEIADIDRERDDVLLNREHAVFQSPDLLVKLTELAPDCAQHLQHEVVSVGQSRPLTVPTWTSRLASGA